MQPAVKDVQDRLLTVRTCHRKEGEVPYPLKYSKDLQNCDNWSRLFLSQYVKNGLTLHEFERPPWHVLDLGCGAGTWILDAAAQWKETRFVGLDLPEAKHLQPSTLRNNPTFEKTAARIRWVHANLLEGLPFPPNEFDFVRVVGIGMGVPEDEWQYVLEEIGRVLKPGGVVEIVEDDLIFPCSPRSNTQVRRVKSLNCTSPTSVLSTHSTNTLSTLSSVLTSSLEDIPKIPPGMIPFPRKQSGSLGQDSIQRKSSSASMSSQDCDYDGPDGGRQNHEKLKTAFENMLASRFLSPRTLSVLPFYLQSIFDDLWSYPTLHIPLPPNSSCPDIPESDYKIPFDATAAFALSSNSRVSNESGSDRSSRLSDRDKHYASLWAPMHLARTVEIIKACKEAIWGEYEQLYGNEAELPPVVKTNKPKDIRAFSSRASAAREQFDKVWWNWENDMTDRMRLRTLIKKECNIPEPNGEKPDWQIWRKRISGMQHYTDEQPQEAMCRSIRGFVGFKRTSR